MCLFGGCWFFFNICHSILMSLATENSSLWMCKAMICHWSLSLQESTLHIPTDIRDGDAQQQSDLSGGAASVEEDVAAPPDNSGTNHTRDSGSEVVLPEKKVQGLLSKDARSASQPVEDNT
jgi:hypothetical protein